MQRIYPPSHTYSCDLIQQTAFHEAGHAASIYLGNKQKQLPPVYFQIQITKPVMGLENSIFAKVIDGSLIHNLPLAGLDNIDMLTKEEQLEYTSAYEADVINYLVGPLAEAKYVSIRDDEALNFYLLNTNSLNYYGGSSDLEKANAYLEYFITSKAEREEKMLDLFSQAFDFIDNQKNWTCILNLAHYILNSDNDIVTCEQAIDIFDQCLR